MDASLASDLAGAAERLLAAARNVERHVIAHGSLADPVDLRTDEERFDKDGNLRGQGHGGGTPNIDEVTGALAEVQAAHDALTASLDPRAPAPAVVEQ